MSVQEIKEIGHHKLQEICLTIENHIAVMKLQPLAAAVALAGLWYEIWLVQNYINQNKDIWMCFLRSDLKTFCSCVDIQQLQQGSSDKNAHNKEPSSPVTPQSLFNLRVPLICDLECPSLGQHVIWVHSKPD